MKILKKHAFLESHFSLKIYKKGEMSFKGLHWKLANKLFSGSAFEQKAKRRFDEIKLKLPS